MADWDLIAERYRSIVRCPNHGHVIEESGIPYLCPDCKEEKNAQQDT